MSPAGAPRRPALAGLEIADAPERWERLGFAVNDGRVVIGGIELSFGAAGRGITGWTLRGVADDVDLDGLVTAVTAEPAPAPAPEPEPEPEPESEREPAPGRGPAGRHPNGAVGIDQVVVTTPDFDRTAAALDAAGIPLRRVQLTAGGSRQGFRRLGPAILELVEAVKAPPGPARFWGLVVIVPDLAALRDQLSPLVGEIREAVQPGRHIAGLSRDAGLSVPVAFMDPE